MKTTLYRFYDAESKLLYVGIAGSFARRFEDHRQDRAWWDEIASARFEHFTSRAEALVAEWKAITRERPIYNIAHNSGVSDNGSKSKIEQLAEEIDDELRERKENIALTLTMNPRLAVVLRDRNRGQIEDCHMTEALRQFEETGRIKNNDIHRLVTAWTKTRYGHLALGEPRRMPAPPGRVQVRGVIHSTKTQTVKGNIVINLYIRDVRGFSVYLTAPFVIRCWADYEMEQRGQPVTADERIYNQVLVGKEFAALLDLRHPDEKDRMFAIGSKPYGTRFMGKKANEIWNLIAPVLASETTVEALL